MRMIISPASPIKPGAPLTEVVAHFEEKLKDDPMLKVARQKTGESLLCFIVNGDFIKPEDYAATLLKDGDDVRVQHPYFGG